MHPDDMDNAIAERWLEAALKTLCGIAGGDGTYSDLPGLAGLTGRLIDLPPGAQLEIEIGVRRRRVAFE